MIRFKALKIMRGETMNVYYFDLSTEPAPNPLGARALYIGATIYRIHGTNAPETIGQAVSSGCFRMVNEDVTDLYSRVPVGTKVMVQHQ
jgi:lipoprotein-anchoring transpeptidase ErfK/SrfK